MVKRGSRSRTPVTAASSKRAAHENRIATASSDDKLAKVISSSSSSRNPEVEVTVPEDEDLLSYLAYLQRDDVRPINTQENKAVSNNEVAPRGEGTSSSSSASSSRGFVSLEKNDPKLKQDEDTKYGGEPPIQDLDNGSSSEDNLTVKTSQEIEKKCVENVKMTEEVLDHNKESNNIKNGETGEKCIDKTCIHSRNEGLATANIFSLSLKRATNIFTNKNKVVFENPLDLLLSGAKSEVLKKITEAFNKMRGRRAYKGLYLWDTKRLGIMMTIGELVKEFAIAAKTDTNIFTLEMYHSEMSMNDQYQRINRVIEKVIKQSSISPCILFIERIDALMNSVCGDAKLVIDDNLDNLFLHPILLVATSTENLSDSTEAIRKLFLDHKGFQLPRPNKYETVKLFFQVFIKNTDFSQTVYKADRERPEDPYVECVDCMKKYFGQKFADVMKNILGICENRTAIFVSYLHGFLSRYSEKNGFKGAVLNLYFSMLEKEINKWKETKMADAVKLYDR